ncbi:SAV_2336 family protein [Streptomyces sp. NBC_00669]|uniref:SAV_2336 N-terminal domain-related protein n=1 Tax=Streptomyces sp. NBC_00669 TaxID=2976011 RepID=UPI002E31A474|nr:SAV_2336 N-terminal domain-related protein [Streptomyces sp. NBC_00669]
MAERGPGRQPDDDRADDDLTARTAPNGGTHGGPESGPADGQESSQESSQETSSESISESGSGAGPGEDTGEDTGAATGCGTDPDDRAAARATDPLTRVVSAISRAGLDPDPAEIADALWLARWSRPTARPDPETLVGPHSGSPGAGVEYPRAHRPDGTDGAGTRLVPPAQPPPVHVPPEDRVISLYPGEGYPGQVGSTPAGAALGVAVPEAGTLPQLLELQSALRPLQRYRSPARPLRVELDESATAERAARAGGLLLPVFRPASHGDAAMQLLMDTSSSMFVWERMLRELSSVFERLGAFHEVHVRYLHATPDGTLGVSGRFDPEPASLRSAEQLSDPTGRRITLMVSDCAGPLWRSGQAHRLLHRLSRHGPVGVLQPLPARLWSRTLLPVSYGVLHRAEGMLLASPLRFSPGATGVPAAPDALPVPVLPPTAAALGAWARLLAGMGAGEVPAAVGWVRADQPAVRVRPRRATVPVPALVRRFRAAASPAAAQLAVYLAAAPLFLPVIQLVQRTMLPDSGPAELAEVLLSGLVVRKSGDDQRWYHFAPGVRDALLGPLGVDEARLVLKHCSEYVEQRFGKSGPNFPALAITQLAEGPGDPTADAAVRSAVQHAARGFGPDGAGSGSGAGRGGEDGTITESRQPFAEVAARVLERFMPLPDDGTAPSPYSDPYEAVQSSTVVQRARDLADRFTAEGMVQNLLDAVAMLRRAAAEERVRGLDPELWTELAQQLLRLWRLRGGTDLLGEAREAAETAAAHHSSLPARAVRARVLQATAQELAAIGDNRGALELLQRADREFTAVCAAPGLDSAKQLDATLERVAVLEEQWAISGDTALLQETVGTLEAVADSWSPQRPRPSELSLALGRALLRLADAAGSRERKQTYAQQAGRSYAGALIALRREQAAPEAVTAATLSLVDAELLSGGRLVEAQRLVDRALGETRDRLQRAAILARAGRIRVARHAEGGPPGELEAAAGRFEEACRLTPRDRTEYRDLVAEWGAALLARSELPGGWTFVNRAVLVLRDCRMETPESDPQQPERLLMLGRALILRYRAEQELVDLREAEQVLGLAAQGADGADLAARIWFELGESHRLVPQHSRRPERLDQAAEAYRKAAAAASDAARSSAEPEPMVRLAARAHHWRGDAYETARRPRAAVDAYRAALRQWRQLPDDGGEEGRDTGARLDALTS